MRRRDPTRVWSRSIGVLMAAALVMLAATPAFAEVCVRADKEKDNLSASEREAVKVIVSDALEARGKTVVDSNCDGTYQFYNVKLGSTIRATLVGPDGKRRQLETNSIDDLSKIYEQLVEALLTGKTTREVADRDTVTSGQQNKERFSADNLGYLRLGYAMVVGAGFSSGPSFGFGWRHELRNFAIDLSIPNINLLVDDQSVGPRTSG
ncbi:MAG: hypothetical protein ABEL76_16745, partial [Bradymonadaceae bacterium]